MRSSSSWGHEVTLIGDFTGLIGDPSGREVTSAAHARVFFFFFFCFFCRGLFVFFGGGGGVVFPPGVFFFFLGGGGGFSFFLFLFICSRGGVSLPGGGVFFFFFFFFFGGGGVWGWKIQPNARSYEPRSSRSSIATQPHRLQLALAVGASAADVASRAH